jgi:hypothetical protein
VLGVTAATLVCATVFVVLRLISRIGIVRRMGWDDRFIVLAWVGWTRNCSGDQGLTETLTAPGIRDLVLHLLWDIGWPGTT